MIAPYFGRFIVTQRFKENKHDGFDLMAIDSPEVHSVSDGTVIYAGRDKRGGFGLFVAVEMSDGDVWYYAHLKSVKVSVLDRVKVGDLLGIEGNTGNSTGNHLHICIRKGGSDFKGYDPSAILGIPNAETPDGEYLEYIPAQTISAKVTKRTPKTIALEYFENGVRYTGTLKPKGD